MPKVIKEKDGSFRLPEDYLLRQRPSQCGEWWFDQLEGAIVLLPSLPDQHKLYVEPTSICNLNYRTCIRNVWDDNNIHMEMKIFRRLIEQTNAFPDLHRIVISGLGESLTHSHLLDMIRLARDRDLVVTLCTNGLLLNKSVSIELVRLSVDRLVISLDGVKPETYASVRGAVISQVLDNIRSMNEAKRKLGSLMPALGIEFVALKSNITELAGLSGLASLLGAARVLVSNVLA